MKRFDLLERGGEKSYEVILTAQGSGTYTANVTVEADNEDDAKKFAIEDVNCDGDHWVLDDYIEYDEIAVEEIKKV